MAGSGRKKKDNDWGSWALIVFLFAIQLWTVALFLLFAKLFGSDAKQKQEAPPLQTERARTGQSAQSSKAKKAVGKVTKSPTAKKSNAKWLKIIGAVLAV